MNRLNDIRIFSVPRKWLKRAHLMAGLLVLICIFLFLYFAMWHDLIMAGGSVVAMAVSAMLAGLVEAEMDREDGR